jgi:hypothetical protein
VYEQIRYIKLIVKHSVVLTPATYTRLEADAEYGRAARAAADAAGGAGAGSADASAYTYVAGAGFGRGSGRHSGFDYDSVGVEDSE